MGSEKWSGHEREYQMKNTTLFFQNLRGKKELPQERNFLAHLLKNST